MKLEKIKLIWIRIALDLHVEKQTDINEKEKGHKRKASLQFSWSFIYAGEDRDRTECCLAKEGTEGNGEEGKEEKNSLDWER